MNQNDRSYLEIADRIAHRICRDAVWAGNQCNWLGWSLNMSGLNWQPVYGAQPAAPFDGTSGIGYFLAALFRETGENIVRETARGALEQAYQSTEDPEPERLSGYYSGMPGIASMMIAADPMLPEGDWTERGLMVLDRFIQMKASPAFTDVMTGSAGVIPVLLDAAIRFERPEYVRHAVDHGEFLIEQANRSDEGWSWSGSSAQNYPDLLGYSHGAGGVVCALLELHKVTGDSRWREAALEGLRYERFHFDSARGSWPDLRIGANTPHLAVSDAARFPVAWNHGAVSVGCSRIIVRDLLKEDEVVVEELTAAVNTAVSALAPASIPNQTFCLSHGIAGNADFLLLAADLLDRPELRDHVTQAARFGQTAYAQPDMPWPCGGTTRGETPNLFLGLAGIGYFYLRLFNPSLYPSTLLIHTKTKKISETALTESKEKSKVAEKRDAEETRKIDAAEKKVKEKTSAEEASAADEKTTTKSAPRKKRTTKKSKGAGKTKKKN